MKDVVARLFQPGTRGISHAAQCRLADGYRERKGELVRHRGHLPYVLKHTAKRYVCVCKDVKDGGNRLEGILDKVCGCRYLFFS